MVDCTVQKAFDSLWSVTDEIFQYVAEIRSILNGAKGSVDENLPSDPPPYENPACKPFIEYLSQKLICLENLNEKRKTILVEFSSTLKNEDINTKKQITEIPNKNAYANPSDNALKSLVSYTRARQAALITNMNLVEEASQKLLDFRGKIDETDTTEEEPICGCSEEAQKIFLEAMQISQRLSTNLSIDRVEQLREGKMLEETVLKVPHETNEETSKILEDVQHLRQQMMDEKVFTFNNYISSFLENYLRIEKRHRMSDTVTTVIINMERSLVQRTRMAQEYNQALQALADHLIT